MLLLKLHQNNVVYLQLIYGSPGRRILTCFNRQASDFGNCLYIGKKKFHTFFVRFIFHSCFLCLNVFKPSNVPIVYRVFTWTLLLSCLYYQFSDSHFPFNYYQWPITVSHLHNNYIHFIHEKFWGLRNFLNQLFFWW